MLLNVETVTPAKTGKSLRVKAGGDWYGAKKDSGITAGMSIEAEIEDGDFGKWINKWKAVSPGQPVAPGVSAAKPNGGGATPTWLPFASNTVAHAISAGLCDEPGKVSAWAKAAKDAYEALS